MHHHSALVHDQAFAQIRSAPEDVRPNTARNTGNEVNVAQHASFCALPRGYATIFLSLTGLITQRTCHPGDELAFDGIGLYQGAIITLLKDGQQFSHRDHCTSVPIRNSAGDLLFILGLCFLSPTAATMKLALGYVDNAINAVPGAQYETQSETSCSGTRGNSPVFPIFEGGPQQMCLKAVKLSRGGLAPYVLRRIERHLRDHLPGAVGLASLATISGLSVSHFAREFKRSLGIAPCQFIQQCRLRLAADVIVKTAQPLADIALEMGFADQSHFSRSFTRVFGTTPREFRRNYTEIASTNKHKHTSSQLSDFRRSTSNHRRPTYDGLTVGGA
jgi:AraC-like DNA-binding protein